MAQLNGVEYSGQGWSVPAELWPAAVTRGRGRRTWDQQLEDDTMDDEPEEDDTDEDDTHCCMCDGEAVTEYEGMPSCGSWRCELRMQRGLDYISERGG